jgi:hypothetical protein
MLDQWDEGRTSGRKLITMGGMGPVGGRTRPIERRTEGSYRRKEGPMTRRVHMEERLDL